MGFFDFIDNVAGFFGTNWKSTLYYTADADDVDVSIQEILDDELRYWNIESDEEIVHVWIFKQNVHKNFRLFAGVWHEFVIVKSINLNTNRKMFWSFEKNYQGICVQRGRTFSTLQNYYRGKRRPGTVNEGSIKQDQKVSTDKTVQDIFLWIYCADLLNKGYLFCNNNSNHFASLLFEAITGQKWTSSTLDNNFENLFVI